MSDGRVAIPEEARTLVRRVSRAFYEPMHCAVVDQLMHRQPVIAGDKLSSQMCLTVKDLARVAQRLVDDQIVSVHRRAEVRAEFNRARAQQRPYYYIDYARVVNVVKWRLMKIRKQIEDSQKTEFQDDSLQCTRCGKEYTLLQVGFLASTAAGLVCERCGSILKDNTQVLVDSGASDKSRRFNEETQPISDVLRRLDTINVPRIDPEAVIAAAHAQDADVPQVEHTAEGDRMVVHITDEDEPHRKYLRDEGDRRRNTVPEWISKSTVSGEATGAGAPAVKIDDVPEDGDEDESGDDLDEYYGGVAEDVRADAPVPAAAADVPEAVPAAEAEPADGAADVVLTVAGKPVPFRDITEDMANDMTPDEYEAYWEVMQREM